MRLQANKFDTNIPWLSKACVKSLALPIQGQHGDIPALLWASQLETGLQLFPFQKHLSKQQQSQRQVSPVSVGDSSWQKSAESEFLRLPLERNDARVLEWPRLG